MLSRDLTFAIRALTNSPSYAIAAILTLALGVSAATTIFSVVDDVLLGPFPIPAVDRLVSISAVDRQNRAVRFAPAVADFLDWREQNQTMERLTAARFWFYTLDAEPGDGRSLAEEIHGWRVSPGHLRMFGAQPMLGRLFTEDEATPGSDRVAVITHGLWQRRFGAAPDIVGQTLRADSDLFTIVGVLSPDFYPFRALGKEVELWMPLSFTEIDRTSRDPAIGAYGLLKPGVTLAEAQAEFDLIAQQLESQYPDTNRDRGVELVGFAELTASAIAPRLHILSAAVGFVLLLACVNVAGLMLVRGAGRSREFAVRLALGANRWRVMRQLLVENLVLSALGGALAVVLSLWSIRAIAVLLANDLPVHVNPDVDWRVCTFALLVSMATALVFSVIPALVVSSSQPADVLKAQGRTATLGIGGQRFRNLMVVSELGLTLALLVTAGLLLQTMRNLDAANRGLDTSNRLTMQVRLLEDRYDTPERVSGFYDEALERILALPGVENAAASSFLPISDVWVSTNYEGSWASVAS